MSGIDSLINILSWCGYTLSIDSNDDTTCNVYKTTFNNSTTKQQYEGHECATIEMSIRHAVSIVIQNDNIVATIIALAACGGHLSNYKNIIDDLQSKKGIK